MKLKIILTTILVSAVCVGLLLTLSFEKDNSNEICKQLVIKIESIGEKNYVTKDMVVNLLNSKKLNPENKKRAEIDLVKIRETIEKNFAVKQAKCYLTKDNKFKIDIVQRKPFFKVVGKKTCYVEDDDKNRAIFTTAPDFNADVPIVKGIFPDSIAQKEIFDFIKFLKNDKFFSENVKEIYVENDYVKFILQNKNQTIIIEKLKDNNGIYNYKPKFERLKDFYEKVADWEKYKEIDLRFDKQIVCR